jgi:hypothetical protein
MISRASQMKKLWIAGVLLQHPLGRRGTVPSASAGQIEDEIWMLVESMLAANGLDIVAIQEAPSEPTIQLAEQIFLTPRKKSVDILWLQRWRLRIGHNPHRLQIHLRDVLRTELRFRRFRRGRLDVRRKYLIRRPLRFGASKQTNFESPTTTVRD